MNPEERTLLQKVARQTEENYRMLREIRSTARWARVWGFFKLLLIVVPLVLGYIYLQPYLAPLMDFYGELLGSGEQLKNLGNLLQQVPPAGN